MSRGRAGWKQVSLYINVHDYSGHPFQVQLSRELARRGHTVEHTYCAEYITGRGRLTVTTADPEGLSIVAIEAGAPLAKYRPLHRLRFEARYAEAWLRYAAGRRFDLTVMCNVPLFAADRIRKFLKSRRMPWVLWHQDMYSLGVNDEVAARLALGTRHVSQYVDSLERKLVRDADQVVAITPSFITQYQRWNLDVSSVHVIPNWAPLDEIVPGPRDNQWARDHEIPESTLRLMYSGTLGRKHNPLLLLDILDRLKAADVDATLIVCSEGEGADDLRRAANGRSDVFVLGFQPSELFSSVLAASDVVLTLLELSASKFSVPSKVLSYLAAGRPIVGLMPPDNPAAADIAASGGFTAAPNADGVRLASEWIRECQILGTLTQIGRQSRVYAEARFAIGPIADRFERVFESAGDQVHAPVRTKRGH